MVAVGAAVPCVCPRHWEAFAGIFVLLGRVMGGGGVRLHMAEGTGTDASGPVVRVVQANVPQREKWRPEWIEPNFARHLAMSLPEAGEPDPDIVIWPETSATFLINEHAGARRRIGDVAERLDAIVITGAPRVERTATATRAYNSAVAIDGRGTIGATADKRHLVPFGEYLPLREILSRIGLDKLAQGRGDFSAGTGEGILDLPGLPDAKALICYEVIFDDEAATDGPRPGWLLSLTNDAWFGTLTGPDQHFAMARFRAVEQALPMVRAAGTGISAVVDAYGQVRARLRLGEAGVISARLPQSGQQSLFAIAGDWPTVGMCFLILVMAIAGKTTIRRRVVR